MTKKYVDLSWLNHIAPDVGFFFSSCFHPLISIIPYHIYFLSAKDFKSLLQEKHCVNIKMLFRSVLQ